jgi:hypothetical protein
VAASMKIVVEFYRTRDADNAHAVVARETTQAADLDSAIEIARQLSRTRREWIEALFRAIHAEAAIEGRPQQ